MAIVSRSYGFHVLPMFLYSMCRILQTLYHPEHTYTKGLLQLPGQHARTFSSDREVLLHTRRLPRMSVLFSACCFFEHYPQSVQDMLISGHRDLSCDGR